MEFNQNNKIVLLCSQGMDMEGRGKPDEASELFLQAWNEATTDFEKLTASHYVARHQKNTSEKLLWDKKSLKYALQINDEAIKATLPSLYLNIGKCYEDLNDFEQAKYNYMAAFSFVSFLPNNGYGNMIKSGITIGLERLR